MEENKDLNQTPPIESSPIEASYTEQTPPTGKPKLKLPMLIGLIVIAVVIFLVGGFFALNSYIRYQEIKPSGIVVIPTMSTSKPIPDPTANWKTYTNTTLGYSIKYPNSFMPPSIPPESPVDGSEGIGANLIFRQENPQFYMILVVNPTTKTLDDLEQEMAAPITVNGENGKYDIKNKLYKKFTIDGTPAVWYTIFPGDLSERSDIALVKNGYQYSFSTPYMKNTSDNIKLVDQILSSFKFTNQNSTSTCTPQPSICKNDLVGAYPKECVEPTNGWCPE